MKLRFDASKCTGCQACQMACLDQNDIHVSEGQKPLCKITCLETASRVQLQFRHCIHCGKCAEVCPSGCLSLQNGLVLANDTLCISCRACEAVCPMDVISFVPSTGTVQKCDGCIGRVSAGLLPACVHTCPTGALSCDGEEVST